MLSAEIRIDNIYEQENKRIFISLQSMVVLRIISKMKVNMISTTQPSF